MSNKPLGIKSYGSIAHLPNSRMGPGDHHCSPGQARIATEQTRDRHDLVIVQEKLDGSNVGVAKVNGQIVPLTRSGYVANTSPYEQHHKFHGWVMRRWGIFDALLHEGERICGEWLAQAHGTRYRLHCDPFVAFDIFTATNERFLYSEFRRRLEVCAMLTGYDIEYAPVLHQGGAHSIDEAMKVLGTAGFYRALDPVEGAVWRVERKGKVDFLCKYVRPDKKDGCYLPEISGKPPIWNWEGE